MLTEKYLHARNYGCRIRQYVYKGVDMLSMENSKVKAVIALGKGADIVELVYKPMDIDFMWHSFNELGKTPPHPTAASGGGSFLDLYAGGWQDLFPTYGARSLYYGAEIGQHGEACLYPWDCTVVRDDPEGVEVCLSLRLTRSPFFMTKTLSLEEDQTALVIKVRIVNESASTQRFMWGQHPAFGIPFLDDSVRLHMDGTPTVSVLAGAISNRCPFDKETSGSWPMLPAADGKMMDMSRAYAPEDRINMEYCISDLKEGKYEVVNHNLNLGLRMTWDKEVFPYVWVWGMYCGLDQYPWFGRAYVMGIEPWSSVPGNFAQVEKDGNLLSLAAGAALESEMRAEIFVKQP